MTREPRPPLLVKAGQGPVGTKPAVRAFEATAGRPRRQVTAIVVAACVLLLVVVLSIALGAVRLPLGDALGGLLGRGGGVNEQIVRNVRLPRTLLAVLVGANLAVAGLLLQNLTRNPLADPQVLGFSAAGSLVTVLVLVRVPDLPVELLPPIAISGCLVGAALLFAAAWTGTTSPVRLALAGVMLASLFTSFTALLLVMSELTTQAALMWVAGGLFGRGWDHWHATWPYAAAALAAALLLVRSLNILSLGEDHARSLGLHVERTRLLSTCIAACLTGSAVAVAGQIAFVGLLAPHAARLMVGSDNRFMLPTAALLGATLLALSDVISRIALAPTEIPIGVVTAAIGVPFFLLLLRRHP